MRPFHIPLVLLGSLIVLSPGAASAQDFSVGVDTHCTGDGCDPTSLALVAGATAHIGVYVGWIAPFTSEVTITTPTYPDIRFTPSTFVITEPNKAYDLSLIHI